jgi:uncharacterized RDD family membrane protein YckC
MTAIIPDHFSAHKMNCTNHPGATEGVFPCDRCARPFCPSCVVSVRGEILCGYCKVEYVRDLRSGVNRAALVLSGFDRRFGAWFVDRVILSVPAAVVLFAFLLPALQQSSTFEPPSSLTLITWGMLPIYIIYEALMLQFRGQTLGKMAMQIKVVKPTGEPISAGQAWGRSVVRVVFISGLALINYITAFFNREKQCIHDMAARTRVIIADHDL